MNRGLKKYTLFSRQRYEKKMKEKLIKMFFLPKKMLSHM